MSSCFRQFLPDVMAAVRGAQNVEAARVVCAILVLVRVNDPAAWWFLRFLIEEPYIPSALAMGLCGPLCSSSLPCVAALAGLAADILAETSD
jgi:hypothetical protein